MRRAASVCAAGCSWRRRFVFLNGIRLNVVDAAAMHRRLVEGSREWLRQWQQARVRRPRHIYPGLGSPNHTWDWVRPVPHLRWDCARRCHVCTDTGLTPAASASAMGSPCCICTGTGYAPATLQLGSSPPHLQGLARPRHICAGTGLAPATSAPGLGSPLPHLRRDSARLLVLSPKPLSLHAECRASRCTRCTPSLHAARRVVACPRAVCLYKRIAGARRPSRPRAVGWCSRRRSACAGPSDRATLRGRPTSPPRSDCA